MSVTCQEIVANYSHVVERHVRRRSRYIAWLGQTDDDVRQLVWLYILKHSNRVREGARSWEVAAWIDLVVRTVLDRARLQKFSVTKSPCCPVISVDDTTDEGEPLNDRMPSPAEDVDLRIDIERAIRNLKPEQAETVLRVLLMGDDESEVAREQGVTRQAVNVKKQRGLDKLQRRLREWRQ